MQFDMISFCGPCIAFSPSWLYWGEYRGYNTIIWFYSLAMLFSFINDRIVAFKGSNIHTNYLCFILIFFLKWIIITSHRFWLTNYWIFSDKLSYQTLSISQSMCFLHGCRDYDDKLFIQPSFGYELVDD